VTSHDLKDRADLDALLQAFYGAALDDELLGPVFASASMDLAAHLPRIVSFWEVTLLGTGEYFGRPMQLHRHLADTAGLGAPHFERWLALWDQTLTAMFAGPTVHRAKTEAARLGDRMLHDLIHSSPRPLTAALHARPQATA
jgi:hemoglobin